MLCFIFKEEVLRYIILKAFIVSCVFLNFSVFGQEAQDDEYADKITNPDLQDLTIAICVWVAQVSNTDIQKEILR